MTDTHAAHAAHAAHTPDGTHASDASPNRTAPSPNRTALLSNRMLSNRMALVLGIALAVAVTDPATLVERGPVAWLFTAAAMVGAAWAAPVIAQRPAVTAVHWFTQLSRHRNTVFAVGCTIIAGFAEPPLWLAIVDVALLLAYLLTVDALAAGPIGIRQLRRGVAPSAAAIASAVALLGAHAPVNAGAVWGRVVAAVAVAAAALAAGAALWFRRQASAPDDSASPAQEQQKRGTRPRHL